MDLQTVLDRVLAEGKEAAKEVAEEGVEKLEDYAGLPDDPVQKEEALGFMKKGAIAAGTLSFLVATKFGRFLTGGMLKIGGIAGVSALAYKAVQTYIAEHKYEGEVGTPLTDIRNGPEAEARKRALVRAMFGAAKADGEFTQNESQRIVHEINKLGLKEEDAQWVSDTTMDYITPEDVAKDADSLDASAEIYLATRAIINPDSPANSEYLAKLTSALKMDEELIAALNNELDKATAA